MHSTKLRRTGEIDLCHIKRSKLFLNVTTSEKKNGFLLIEVFRKIINTQNDGHLDQLWVAIYYLSGYVVILHFDQFLRLKTMREDK
jgi:hypothetical protein